MRIPNDTSEELIGQRPLRRCPEFECTYVEHGIRVITTQRNNWWSARTRINVSYRWTSDKCPYDGSPLVEYCEACKSRLVAANDVFCRGCGRRYWWMAEGDWSDAAPTWKSKDTFLEEVGRISVYAALASIAVVAADAVVSTDNQLGMMTSRTARALKRRGGDDIEIESMTKRRGIGEAWNTNAGRLNVNHVIHVALLDDRAATSAETIGKSVTNSLLVADELKLESLVFPALGTGRGGFPIADSARIARARLHEHVEKSPTGSIRAVGFALYSPEDHRDFRAGYLPEAR